MTKFVDIANIFLFLLLIFLASMTVRIRGFVPVNKNIPLEALPTPSGYGKNRDFPPDFSKEEKLLLTEPYHDYERVTQQMDDDYEYFHSLFKTFVSYDPVVEVIRHNDDCFFRPVILSIKNGQAVTIKNNYDVGVSSGLGGDSWEIPPFGEVVVYPKLKVETQNQNYWQYSCSEKGIGGYFVEN